MMLPTLTLLYPPLLLAIQNLYVLDLSAADQCVTLNVAVVAPVPGVTLSSLYVSSFMSNFPTGV